MLEVLQRREHPARFCVIVIVTRSGYSHPAGRAASVCGEKRGKESNTNDDALKNTHSKFLSSFWVKIDIVSKVDRHLSRGLYEFCLGLLVRYRGESCLDAGAENLTK